MLLDGKRVIIAGIGPGLGRALAHGASADGAAVTVVARSDSTVDALTAELKDLGRPVAGVVGDLTTTDDCERIVAEANAAFGGVDGIVYNAFSDGPVGGLDRADIDEWRRVMDVNAFGAMRLVQAALTALQKSRGAVVLIGSRQMRRPTRACYAMSKAALLTAGQALAHELGPTGVRVNAVVPGWMWGPPVQGHLEAAVATSGKSVDEQYRQIADAFPLREMTRPAEVADAVMFLLSDRAGTITGQALDVNAGEIFH